MGKIVITEFVSLDGVIEDPGGAEDYRYGGWTFEIDRGDEGNAFKLDETMATDALLLGRKTYEGFAEAWPQRDGEFADKFNSMPKYVVSSTLERAGVDELDGRRRQRPGRSGRDDQGAPRGRRRRPRQRAPRAGPDRPGSRRRAAPDGLPGRARRRQAPLRPDGRQEAASPVRLPDGRRRRRRPDVRAHGRGRVGAAPARGGRPPAGRPTRGCRLPPLVTCQTGRWPT